MKKFITMIVLALGITLTTQAQQKGKDQKEQFTPEQKTTLKVKKMTLKLDLTDNQVKQVTPIVRKQVEAHNKMREQRKGAKKGDHKMTADERFAKANKKLDRQIAVKKEMKKILNEEQYKKFEKMAQRKQGKKGKKEKKEQKGQKNSECNKKSCEHKK